MKKVDEKDFPILVEIYNTKGRRAVNAHIRETYGLKNPWYVVQRICKTPGYKYDETNDRFEMTNLRDDENIFMSMDELCGKHNKNNSFSVVDAAGHNLNVSMEKLIHELISDRLLELSRYVSLETSSRTILIDKTSMVEAGYSVITH